MRNKSILIWILISFTIFISCSPKISRVHYDSIEGSKGSDCEFDVYYDEQKTKKPVKTIGEMEIGDTGFSTNCSAHDVFQIIRKEACFAGANAVRLFNVRHPDFWSTCYRANVLFYKYSD